MGPRARRQGRRRGLIVGAAIGSAAARHGNNNDQTQPASDSGDGVAELEQLAALKEKGIISEEEFQAKKKQILGL